MSFNINDFKANLTRGGSRPSLFQCHITNPISPSSDQKAPFMIRASQMPSRDLSVIQVPYFGRRINYAGTTQFRPWNVTVINDEDFAVRNDLEKWANAINSLEGNIATADVPLLYKSQGTITQYAKNGSVLRIYQFNGIWPSEISQIDTDWSQDAAISEFQVTFMFDSYEIIGGGSTGDGGGK